MVFGFGNTPVNLVMCVSGLVFSVFAPLHVYVSYSWHSKIASSPYKQYRSEPFMIWLPRATILYKQSQACLNPSPRGRYRYFSIWIIWHFDSLGADTLIRHTPLPKFTGPLEDRTRSLWFSTTIAPPHPIDRNHRRPMPPWMLKEGVCYILYTGY